MTVMPWAVKFVMWIECGSKTEKRRLRIRVREAVLASLRDCSCCGEAISLKFEVNKRLTVTCIQTAREKVAR